MADCYSAKPWAESLVSTMLGQASPEPPLIQAIIPANSEAAEFMQNDPNNEDTPAVRVSRVLYVLAEVRQKSYWGSHLQELASLGDFALKGHETDL